MSSSTMIANMNAILDPFLFQVVGSTPESVRDSIKSSSLKNKAQVAMNFACACVFAAAVNKATMEGFISKPELSDARPVISSAFSIQGRANMTGLTLLGHCILTTKYVDNITFAKEFRKKMGQDNLWEGNLTAGSLSEKQKEILTEKKRVTPKESAMLLGSGFFKFTGIVNDAYTREEADFWGEAYTGSRDKSGPGSPSDRRKPSYSSRLPASPPRPGSRQQAYNVPMSDGTVTQIPKEIAEYYLTINNGDEARLAASIEKRGGKDFVDMYAEAMEKDPERKGGQGGTVLG
jgi:hypothetical protein